MPITVDQKTSKDFQKQLPDNYINHECLYCSLCYKIQIFRIPLVVVQLN